MLTKYVRRLRRFARTSGLTSVESILHQKNCSGSLRQPFVERLGAALGEIARAQQAFSTRAYMIVVDNQRVWEPDTLLTLRPETQVEFIKILPLVGG